MTPAITGTAEAANPDRAADFLKEAADALGLSGWVEMTESGGAGEGRVRFGAEGPEDVLGEFVAHLHRGSAVVALEGLSVAWGQVAEPGEHFLIHYP